MFRLLETMVIAGGILFALFLVLLAIPKCPLRSYLLELMGYAGAATSALGVVSPIDVIPDFIPVLGWLDDLAYVPIGLLCLAFAVYQHVSRQEEAESATKLLQETAKEER
jgi:uncharacterized membrane protein YkvA (DUF1232 family)